VKNPARGGGRWVDVTPQRLSAWVETFAVRHCEIMVTPAPDVVTFTAADGSQAECHVPFPPLPDAGDAGDAGGAGDDVAQWAEVIARHAAADRTVGVLLVRLGGYAAGVFTGAPPRLAASKVGSRLVHGRSAAGGQSQQRFARRREKQAAEALSAAAGNADAVLRPFARRLDAVVLGGDRSAIAGLRGDPRLERYFKLATDRFLTVPDPRLAVLQDTPRMFQAIRIRLT
jgi:Actinobacteria/chloroflexi VLRF1 release factor